MIIEGSHLVFVGRYYFTPIFFKRNVIKYFQLNHVVTKAKDRRLMKYIVELVEARARDHDVLQRAKECAHVRLPFHLTAATHVTQNTRLCRQRQLFRASLKKQST